MTKKDDNGLAICYYNSFPGCKNDVSIEQQREAAHRYAADKGLTIVREYEDRYIPGLKRDAEYRRMLAELDMIHPVALIIWGTDRISHKPFEIAMMKQAIREANCGIHTIIKPDPGNTDEVYLMETLLNTMTKYPFNCPL